MIPSFYIWQRFAPALIQWQWNRWQPVPVTVPHPKGIELAGTSTSTAIIPPAIGWWWTKPEEFPMPAGSIKAGIRAGL